ncbi:SRR1-like protein isoform X2 [Pituophis catenifer annectens]|uniref:SRR1-like protein isoform X2 n=1 Tax=Pituophis catenifer annectens TaxID=94852 RepID=UPI003991F86D
MLRGALDSRTRRSHPLPPGSHVRGRDSGGAGGLPAEESRSPGCAATGAAEGRSSPFAFRCCCGMSADGGLAGGDRRRRRRRRPAKDERPEAAGERQRRRLQEALSELKDSDFWESSRRTIAKALRSPPAAQQDPLAALRERPEGPGGRAAGLRCVCYGLGSFCSCGKARLQLAFLLLLLEELKIAPELCFVFDPVFSTLEIEVLSGLGLTVLQWNEEGKRSIEGPTLFYMIHCGKALYNNLLWSNWSAEALSQMVVVGNSFRGFEERLLAKVFYENYSYIAKKLRDLPQDCWACQPEPLYPEETQLEIIRNKPQ